jgi:hypothetical protein
MQCICMVYLHARMRMRMRMRMYMEYDVYIDPASVRSCLSRDHHRIGADDIKVNPAQPKNDNHSSTSPSPCTSSICFLCSFGIISLIPMMI